MMKKNIIITVIIALVLILLPISKNEAASFTVSNSNVTLDIEKSATITVDTSTHTGRINITTSNSNVATVDVNSLWVENNSQTITISAKNAGTAEITISGELFDSTIEAEETYTKKISVTVNEKIVTPKPETPTTQPTNNPEPEKPKVEEKPNFTDAKKTMYAKNDMNLRESWSTSSKATSIDKGTELKVTSTSNNKVNGYVWYKVNYNGKTLYVASNLLTSTKPEEPVQEQPEEEPKEEAPAEVTTVNEDSETAVVKAGLSSLKIEGLTLSPAFSPDVYEYRVIVKKDISELNVEAVPAVEGATVTIAGNENIKEGENLITIVVYNEKDEVEATYQITTNKSTLDLTETDAMLRVGTKEAIRNLIIFTVALVMIIIALVVVMILKQKHQKHDENEEEQGNQNIDKFTDIEQTVENSNEEDIQSEKIQTEEPAKEDIQNKDIPQNEVEHEEMRIPRREKRKGKHF